MHRALKIHIHLQQLLCVSKEDVSTIFYPNTNPSHRPHFPFCVVDVTIGSGCYHKRFPQSLNSSRHSMLITVYVPHRRRVDKADVLRSSIKDIARTRSTH